MGTFLHLAASGPDPERVALAVEAAIAEVERVDRLMSFHAEDSELARVNRRGSGEAVEVHPCTFVVLRRAQAIAAASEGLFDVTVAPKLVRRGLLPATLPIPPAAGSWRDIELLPGHRVRFRRPVLLDLGGIAKGFAVDRAIHVLWRGGCSDAIVNAGGDLRTFGTQPRPIELRRRDALVRVAELRCGAVATSTPHSPRPDRLAQPLGSIVHPQRDRTWDGIGSVVVAARTCVIADALTKVAALAGPACAPLLARFGAQAYWDVEDWSGNAADRPGPQ